MNKDEVKVKIKAFLAQFFKNYNLQDDENIFSLGFINSMFAMQLVLFIEKEFNIKIGPEDLDFEHFQTIDSITSLIDNKLK